MRTPKLRLKYALEAHFLLYKAAARAVPKVESGQELTDEELLGVVAAAQPSLITYRQVNGGTLGSEVLEFTTTTPVEAVFRDGGVELRRLT